MLRRLILGGTVAIALALFSALPCAADDKVDITGRYNCEGLNPDGGTYKGKVEITKKGDVYYVKWAIGEGDNYQGIGLREGSTLAVSYYGGITGVVVYKIEKGPKLVGRWAVLEGKDKVYTETLTK